MNGKYYGRLEVRYHKKEAARLEHIKNKRKRSKTMVKGYKVFNPDWTCKGKQYTCPGTFEEDVNPSVCNVGMHFCKNAADCFRYYDFDPNNHVAEVIAHGTVAEGEDKCATNKLEIVREIPWAEVLEIVNTGKACTGRCNSGNRNSGDWNSGDWNSGDWTLQQRQPQQRRLEQRRLEQRRLEQSILFQWLFQYGIAKNLYVQQAH
jgi:hypothetical protein